jgi:hypothetical protein
VEKAELFILGCIILVVCFIIGTTGYRIESDKEEIIELNRRIIQLECDKKICEMVHGGGND